MYIKNVLERRHLAVLRYQQAQTVNNNLRLHHWPHWHNINNTQTSYRSNKHNSNSSSFITNTFKRRAYSKHQMHKISKGRITGSIQRFCLHLSSMLIHSPCSCSSRLPLLLNSNNITNSNNSININITTCISKRTLGNMTNLTCSSLLLLTYNNKCRLSINSNHSYRT